MRKQNNGHRWTDPELRRLIGMWLDGCELDSIAKEFGITSRGVNKQIGRLRRDGVPLPRRNNGHKAERYNAPWTQQEVEYLVRRRNDLATAEQIGSELGRSYLAIQGMIATLRKEGVDIQMQGQGVRRLWNPELLKISIAAVTTLFILMPQVPHDTLVRQTRQTRRLSSRRRLCANAQIAVRSMACLRARRLDAVAVRQTFRRAR